MCRFTFYKGKSTTIGSIIVDPPNSLLSQSRNASFHPGKLYVLKLDDFIS
jgi:hypothetical protein